jgi:rhodanese-related sulfurtransferase
MEDRFITAKTAWDLARKGRAQLIDIRASHETGMPEVDAAQRIPLAELEHELVTLDRERVVVLLSGTGARAVEAAKVLRAAGLSATAVLGGVRGWQWAGLPVREPTSTR